MDPLEIREFAEADRAALIGLWRRCGLTRPWNDPDTDIDLAVASPDAAILVGTLDAVLVATLMLGFDGHRGWVYYFGVDPEHRLRGLGRRMMAAAEGWMRARSVPKIQLMVRDDNRAALGFYAALGYDVVQTTTLGKRLDGRG
jgi:ribosomal protein S18 acetylase RimI-like enzyme